MAIPNGTIGYGNRSKATNVFKFDHTQDLSSAIRYKCFDEASFPTTGSLTTTANIVLAGKTGNGDKSMVSLLDTTDAPSTVFDWKPWDATGGEANPNRMEGSVSYVDQDGSDFTTGTDKTFNLVIEVPDDTLTTDSMAFDLEVTYTYTGSVPTVTFQYNDDLSGTEGTPTWINMTINTDGIKHTRAGVSSPDLFANIPATTKVETVIFDGSGLDDATSGGAFSDTANAKFDVNIDGTGSPDTFQWRKNEGSYTTTVNCSTSPVALSDSVTIVWAADTGHTTSDNWTFYCGSEDTVEGWATT